MPPRLDGRGTRIGDRMIVVGDTRHTKHTKGYNSLTAESGPAADFDCGLTVPIRAREPFWSV